MASTSNNLADLKESWQAAETNYQAELRRIVKSQWKTWFVFAVIDLVVALGLTLVWKASYEQNLVFVVAIGIMIALEYMFFGLPWLPAYCEAEVKARKARDSALNDYMFARTLGARGTRMNWYTISTLPGRAFLRKSPDMQLMYDSREDVFYVVGFSLPPGHTMTRMYQLSGGYTDYNEALSDITARLAALKVAEEATRTAYN